MNEKLNITWIGRRDPSCASGNLAALGVSSEDVARFWGKVRKDAHGCCWEWTASRTGGRTGKRYGQFTTSRDRRQRHTYAHRFAWLITSGPIPAGLEILHSCDNGLCVNPAHLSLGTHTDNMQDAASRRRLSVPRPTAHKVAAHQLPEIDQLLASGVTQTDIAGRFGVTKAWVCQYANGKRRQYDRPQESPESSPARASSDAAHPEVNVQGVA